MVTLPIEMPNSCKECVLLNNDMSGCSFVNSSVFLLWKWGFEHSRFCGFDKSRYPDCPLQDNKSHWEVEYNEKRRKATYTCANCGTAYQVMLVSKDEINGYADKFCRECGKEMKCAVRTVEPKKEV